jgi:excisionase family DNA binding protein
VDDLLTTKQLHELLQVDRITIYRMLNDGRLQGFKVGGQWRFSRREIETWLQEQQSKLAGAEISLPPGIRIAASPESLPLSCIQTIQSVCAEALDIAAVTTDLEGSPLTEISNSCPFCDLILSHEEGRRRCASSWSVLGNGQARTCHAGLLCVSSPIHVNQKQAAIIAGCQFAIRIASRSSLEWESNLPTLASDLKLDEAELRAATGSVRVLSQESLPRISRLVRRLGGTFSEIGQERLNLLSRLQHIAEMSKI